MDDFEERDGFWVARERERLKKEWSREELLDWLQWNDPDGAYTDEACAMEDMDPLSAADALDFVMEHVAENKETPEEMRRASRR